MQVLSQFHDLILCIISALEARDPYTSHHSSRVAEMTETICELMGLDISYNLLEVKNSPPVLQWF